MKKTITESFQKSFGAFLLATFFVTSFGLSFVEAAPAYAVAVTAKVTINSYVDGVQANATNAQNVAFPMLATYTISGNAGTGNYDLAAGGYNGDPTPYQAMTGDLPVGSDYATNEVLGGTVVDASCGANTFSLVGYTSGNTLAEAQAGTPSATVPSFTAITSDKFVIVWNHDCTIVVPPVPASDVTVTIEKYVDGQKATATTAKNADFTMAATWTATNIGTGSGTYTLGAGNTVPYETATIAMTSGANYATNETIDAVVGASCQESKPFSLVGYSTGATLAEAIAATKTLTAPAFTNMTANAFVIVWNHDCLMTTGGIGGDVTGGTSPFGILGVTGVVAVKTSAIADGTFANGWKYTFNITLPTNETHLAMKFADWTMTGGTNTIAAANNIRISSAQADNSGATVLITGANIYSTPTLTMTTDLDPATAGIQTQVTVETSVPATAANGSYTTSYGVSTI